MVPVPGVVVSVTIVPHRTIVTVTGSWGPCASEISSSYKVPESPMERPRFEFPVWKKV